MREQIYGINRLKKEKKTRSVEEFFIQKSKKITIKGSKDYKYRSIRSLLSESFKITIVLKILRFPFFFFFSKRHFIKYKTENRYTDHFLRS